MYRKVYKYIYGYTIMVREITIKNDDFKLSDKVETIIEKTITTFGNSAKADVPKKYIGKRAYIIILKD